MLNVLSFSLKSLMTFYENKRFLLKQEFLRTYPASEYYTLDVSA